MKRNASPTAEDIKVHDHSNNNREELFASDKCGCFHCLAIFPQSEIEDWIDNDDTAMCPRCHIDSVIGSKSGYPITQEFLQDMQDRWFNTFLTQQEVRDLEREEENK